jgi:hypothetical protein
MKLATPVCRVRACGLDNASRQACSQRHGRQTERASEPTSDSSGRPDPLPRFEGMPWPRAASQRPVACSLTPLSAGCQRSLARNQQILNARTRSDNRDPPTTATNLRDPALRRSFPGEPVWPWPPAFAVTERAVVAWPVVAVGVTVMPASTESSPVLPHPSKHSPHLCLSLRRMGGTQDYCLWPSTCWDPRDSGWLSTRDRR